MSAKYCILGGFIRWGKFWLFGKGNQSKFTTLKIFLNFLGLSVADSILERLQASAITFHYCLEIWTVCTMQFKCIVYNWPSWNLKGKFRFQLIPSEINLTVPKLQKKLDLKKSLFERNILVKSVESNIYVFIFCHSRKKLLCKTNTVE